MTRLSIIIPHYNSPELLIKLLNSIPRREDIQIIVVDDKSDKYLDIYEMIKTNDCYGHISFLENKSEVKSVGTCRNIGLLNATGQWILFADADDYFLEGFYDRVSEFFDSDNDVVFFTPTSVELDTGNISDRHLLYSTLIRGYLNKKDVGTELRLCYSFYVSWSKLIRKRLLDKFDICFDEIVVAEDVMFSTKVGYHMKKYEASESVIYCVTKNRGSLTTIVYENILDINLTIFIERYKYLKKRLNSKEMELLTVCGIARILDFYFAGFGIKKCYCVYKTLKLNRVPILTVKQINSSFFLKEVIRTIKKIRKGKKYYIKQKSIK